MSFDITDLKNAIGCVYLATNLVTGRQYIGKSIYGLEFRRKQHERSLTRDTVNTYFGRALAKYGFEFFAWLPIFISDDSDLLLKAEIELIASYKAAGRGLYNLTIGGEGTKGYVMPEESRNKLKEAWIGRKRKPISAETRLKMSESSKKRIITPETRAKMKASRAGYKHSEETIEKIREKKKRENLSEETLLKMSQSSTGRVCTEETKAKISAAVKCTLAAKKSTKF